MLELVDGATAPSTPSVKPIGSIRCVRPSLLDLRFTGDACVVEDDAGSASVRLDNYRLAHIQTLPFDLPSLNRLFLELRQWQIRRRMYRQLRARRLRALCEAR
jgi:hypothetical protein